MTKTMATDWSRPAAAAGQPLSLFFSSYSSSTNTSRRAFSYLGMCVAQYWMAFQLSTADTATAIATNWLSPPPPPQ